MISVAHNPENIIECALQLGREPGNGVGWLFINKNNIKKETVSSGLMTAASPLLLHPALRKTRERKTSTEVKE